MLLLLIVNKLANIHIIINMYMHFVDLFFDNLLSK